ncbi:hypothetical protein vseg_012301 [Gypsophila vaccaria]
MTYKQSNTKTPSSQTLGLHSNSHTISKIQPKIRIIHIHAPEIIETNVANFRELVQQLTGKPPPSQNKGKSRGRSKKTNSRALNHQLVVQDPLYPLFEDDNNNNNYNNNHNNNNINMPSRTTITGSSSSPSSSCDQLLHHDDDDQGCWRTSAVDLSNSTSGGFLSAFNGIEDHFDLSMFTNTLGAHDHNTITTNNNNNNNNNININSSSHLHLCNFGDSAQLSFRG